MHIRHLLILGCAALLATPLTWAIPSDSLDAGSAPQASVAPADAGAYAAALALLKRGDELDGKPGAREAYASARTKLQSLVGRSPQLSEAWNALGYTQRKLGAFDDALASYGHALELKPGYPEALEYRGEAFLRLGRLHEAKQAYLDLFSANRKIAATLLDSMKAWLKAPKGAHSVDASELQDLKQWVQERSQIATQTAALTREGAAARWR